jgi:hypothetical protein
LDKEQRAIWVYPWDAQDTGISRLIQRARDDWGLTGISLCVSYHNAKFLLPRSSKNKVFLSGGSAIYFRPDERMYRETPLRPIVTSRSELLDIMDQTAEASRKAGLTCSAWTVALHNSRLGEAFPELSEENVFGDLYPWALCPSHPHVRAYAIGLVQDIVVNHGPDAIDLESIGFHGMSHGHHHEVVGTVWGPVEETLLSLCFCPGCLRRAVDAGIDAETLRIDVREFLERRFAEESLMPPQDVSDMRAMLSLLLSWPDLASYIRCRLATVTSLIEEIQHDAIKEGDTQLSVAAATFVKPASNAWLEGMDLRAVSRVVGSMILVSYFHDPASIASDVQLGRDLVGDVDKLKVGMALLHPQTTSAENLRAKVEIARAMGVTNFSFYNYGFVSEARLDWLRELAL